MIFFLFHIEIEGKGGWIIEGGPKGYVAPPPKLLGGLAPTAPPPLPTHMSLRALVEDFQYYVDMLQTH